MTIEDTFWEALFYIALAARIIYQDKEMMFWIVFFGILFFFLKLKDFLEVRLKYY